MRRPLCLRTLKDLARVDGKGWGLRLLSIGDRAAIKHQHSSRGIYSRVQYTSKKANHSFSYAARLPDFRAAKV